MALGQEVFFQIEQKQTYVRMCVSLCVNAYAPRGFCAATCGMFSQPVWCGAVEIKKKIKVNVIKMKSSSIICCCKATPQGLLIGDTSVLGNGRANLGVQWSVTPFYPEGSVHKESDSDDDVIKMGPGMMCLRTVLGYGGVVHLVSSEAWQLHYRQCIIPSNMGKDMSLKKLKK